MAQHHSCCSVPLHNTASSNTDFVYLLFSYSDNYRYYTEHQDSHLITYAHCTPHCTITLSIIHNEIVDNEWSPDKCDLIFTVRSLVHMCVHVIASWYYTYASTYHISNCTASNRPLKHALDNLNQTEEYIAAAVFLPHYNCSLTGAMQPQHLTTKKFITFYCEIYM